MLWFIWFISDQKACIFVCATTVEQNLFLNNRNRKDVGGTYNALVHYVSASAPDPSSVVL